MLLLMMPKLLYILVLISGIETFSQSTDIISVRRKNGRIIKSFVAGSMIELETKNYHHIKGPVQQIKNDSVFVVIYDIRSFRTNLGTTVVDTISTRITGFHYKDILRVKVFKREGFIRRRADQLLMFGGGGYLALNVLNHTMSGSSLTKNGNLKNIGISSAAFIMGFLIKKYFYVNNFTGRKHKIVYIKAG